jgi:hypothetical protein
MSSLSGHLTDVEKRHDDVPLFPYGMPGYGVAGTSALPPPTASAPPLIIAPSAQPTITPSAPLPAASSIAIHHIQFPYSPSPIPSFLSTQPFSDTTAASTSVPCFHKLEFHTFDGKEDLLGWLNCCEQFFHGQCTPMADKV